MGVKFGETLRRARMQRRIPLARVADRLEFSIPYVSDIERGHRNPPSQDKTRLWAQLVHLDPEEMVEIALLDRRKVELSIENQREDKINLAFSLARAWDNMTADQERELLDAVRKIVEA